MAVDTETPLQPTDAGLSQATGKLLRVVAVGAADTFFKVGHFALRKLHKAGTCSSLRLVLPTVVEAKKSCRDIPTLEYVVWNDEMELAAAIRGYDAVILVAPLDGETVAFARTVLDAAAAGGVRHVVCVGGHSVGPAIYPEPFSRDIEALCARCTACAISVLRLPYFLENLLWHSTRIHAGEPFMYPVCGGVRFPYISCMDTGEFVAALILMTAAAKDSPAATSSCSSASLHDNANVASPESSAASPPGPLTSMSQQQQAGGWRDDAAAAAAAAAGRSDACNEAGAASEPHVPACGLHAQSPRIQQHFELDQLSSDPPPASLASQACVVSSFPSHMRVYDLSDQIFTTMHQLADQLSSVLQRPVTYASCTPEQFAADLARQKITAHGAAQMTQLWRHMERSDVAVAEADAAIRRHTLGVFRRLMGRGLHSSESWLAEHACCFSGDGACWHPKPPRPHDAACSNAASHSTQ